MREEIKVKVLTASVLLLVFVAGALVGLALDRSFSPALAGPADHVAGSVGDIQGEEKDEEPEKKSGTMFDRLDLGPEQRVLIDSVLDEFQRRMAGFQREYRPKYWTLVDSSRAEVRQLLTEEQAVLHDSLTMESDRRRGRPGTRRDEGGR